ncbi:MAG TPA: tyrosinase family protein [Caulobacteraceae bacterium]|jgi:hypothetical protein|nr:tyrosinase family protein [Caulobacteraceae bacterium]
MIRPNRRQALALASVFSLAPGLRAFAQDAAAQPPRVRRDLKGMSRSDPDLQALKIGIKKLRASGAWQRQVDLHADMKWLHHSSWRFLPWHRLQVLHMEKLIAKASGKQDFAMPYWDWTDDVLPVQFVNDDVLGHAGRECGAKESIAKFCADNDTTLVDRSKNDFSTFFGKPRAADQPRDSDTPSGEQHFSGSCEWSGHNLIHSFIGGDMGVLETAPNDPLFWVHHANVDRTWSAWAAKHSASDYADPWSVEQLQGYEDPDGASPAAVAAATTIDTEALGYGYAITARPPLGAARAMASRGAGRRFHIQNYTFQMNRVSASQGVIDIPPEASQAVSAQAVGYLTIDPDPQHASVTRIKATDNGDGSTAFDDKMFLVPMGMSMGMQNYRIDLSDVWSGAGVRGLKLEALTGPLVGRRSGEHPPAIASFVVDATALFYD